MDSLGRTTFMIRELGSVAFQGVCFTVCDHSQVEPADYSDHEVESRILKAGRVRALMAMLLLVATHDSSRILQEDQSPCSPEAMNLSACVYSCAKGESNILSSTCRSYSTITGNCLLHSGTL